jgi:catechol 2,3-dioxygenase-like lactoylglutathione lyase family enzyme
MRPGLQGIHHLKFPVSDLDRSCAFYERALDAGRIAALDHRDRTGTPYAYVLEVPDLGTLLELRLDVGRAAAQRGFDPVTLAVEDRASLAAWLKHLDAARVEHSPMLAAWMAWIVVFEDPDGRRLRLYTNETHGPDIEPSRDPRWL